MQLIEAKAGLMALNNKKGVVLDVVCLLLLNASLVQLDNFILPTNSGTHRLLAGNEIPPARFGHIRQQDNPVLVIPAKLTRSTRSSSPICFFAAPFALPSA